MDDQEANDQPAAPNPLDFDTWAALSAALLDLDADQHLALLAEAGIAPDHWNRSDHHHTRALVDDLAAGRMDRANAYAARCAAEKDRRRLAASPPPDAPASLAPLSIEPITLRADLPSAPPSFPPRAAPSPEPDPPLAPRPATARPPALLARTARSPEHPPTPPRPAAKAPVVEIAPPPPAPKPAPTPAAPPAPLEVLPKDDGRPGSHLRHRMILNRPPAEWKKARYFGVAPASPPPGAPPEPPPPSADPPTLPRRPADGAPRAGAAAAPAPELALAVYALLCAELAAAAEPEPAILARYGLADPAARRALDDHWRQLTAADPGVRAELARAVAAYGESFRRQPR